MDPSSMKNIIILKNLPSNMIEEAFVVFKDNIKVHKVENVDKNTRPVNNEKSRPKNYMIKEAEMVIKDYIYQIEEKEYASSNTSKKLKQKYKKLKTFTIFLSIFSLLSLFLILVR